MPKKKTGCTYCFAGFVLVLICIVLLLGLNCDIEYSYYYGLKKSWNIDIND